MTSNSSPPFTDTGVLFDLHLDCNHFRMEGICDLRVNKLQKFGNGGGCFELE